MFYQRYRPGRLEAQPDLSRTLRRTPYAIDFDDLSPMTMSLLATYDALEDIKQEVERIQQFVSQAARSQPPQSSSGIFPGIMDSTTPSVSGSGASVLISGAFRDRDPGSAPRVELVHLYKALHSFYSNGGTSLDRLGWELNRVYDLGLSPLHVDFRSVCKKKGLDKSNPTLHELLSSEKAEMAKRFMRFRNRELHDGVIRIDRREAIVFFPDDFNKKGKPTGSRSELAGLCQQQFYAVEALVSDTYQMMWNDYQRSRSLPLDDASGRSTSPAS